MSPPPVPGDPTPDDDWEDETLAREAPGPGDTVDATLLPDGNAPSIPGVTIHGILGQGGQGIVYSGRQDYLDRPVAVKVLVGDASKGFAERFQREAKILAGLHHPHVVTCYQAGLTPSGQCFMLMELIDGPDLSRWIAKNGHLSVPDALTVTRDIALALEHGQSSSIIHRDVKPQNVLLAPTDVPGEFPYRAKLADLGLARGSDQSSEIPQLTAQGVVMGTPSTMAPEQFDDPDQVDFRADIYGLGCVLYHALVGKLPFSGRTLTQVFRDKIRGEIPDPTETRADLSPAVQGLVKRMLAVERVDRQQSYAELVRDLEALIAGKPSPRSGPKGRSWLPIGLGAGLLAAGALWWLQRDSHEPQDQLPPQQETTAALEESSAGNLPQPEDMDPSAPVAGQSKAADAEAGGDDGPEADSPSDPPDAALQDSGEAPPEQTSPRAPTPGPALPRGARQRLFEAWDNIDDVLLGWEQLPPAPARWNGDEDKISVVTANIGQGELEAWYPLPGGSWALSGTLGATPAFFRRKNTADPRAGLRIRLREDSSLECSVAPRGAGGYQLRWTLLVPDDGGAWVPDPSGPAGEQVLSGETFAFRLANTADGLSLGPREPGSAPFFSLNPAQVGSPARLGLFVHNGYGRWAEFDLEGL